MPDTPKKKETRRAPRAERKNQPDFISLRRKLENFGYIVRQIFKRIPGFATLFLVSEMLIAALDVYVDVYFLKWLIGLIESGQAAQAAFHQIVILCAVTVVLFIINSTLNRLVQHVLWARSATEFARRLHGELFEKATRIELACYDNPKFYNDFVWSMNNSDNLIMEAFNQLGQITNCLTAMVIAGAFIFTTDLFMFSFVIASISVSAALTFWRNRVNYKYSLELNPRIVKRDYIGRIFYLPEYGKEIKLTRVGGLLMRRYHTFIEDMKDVVHRHGKKMALISSFDGMSWDFLFYLANLFYLAFRAIVSKTLSYANFIGLYNATATFHGRITWMMQVIPQLDQKSMQIQNFRAFMEYQPKMGEDRLAKPCENVMKTLEIKNLRYTYDGQETPALDGVNLTVNPGEKIAIVGYNGAGKSTLIKLLMRLYDPQDGSITYGGADIRTFTLSSYRSLFGAVFQDFQIFAATVGENVEMGRVRPERREAVAQALRLSGGYGKVSSLKKGLDTSLTREFDDDGVNLSGGEAQKVAIARVFAKDCSVVVLDEPSSALDPISEYELNETMRQAAQDKSVIFISHRLSTTRDADRIYMLENGKVIEEGTHDELMLRNGKYAQMFILQASNYQQSGVDAG